MGTGQVLLPLTPVCQATNWMEIESGFVKTMEDGLVVNQFAGVRVKQFFSRFNFY